MNTCTFSPDLACKKSTRIQDASVHSIRSSAGERSSCRLLFGTGDKLYKLCIQQKNIGEVFLCTLCKSLTDASLARSSGERTGQDETHTLGLRVKEPQDCLLLRGGSRELVKARLHNNFALLRSVCRQVIVHFGLVMGRLCNFPIGLRSETSEGRCIPQYYIKIGR